MKYCFQIGYFGNTIENYDSVVFFKNINVITIYLSGL